MFHNFLFCQKFVNSKLYSNHILRVIVFVSQKQIIVEDLLIILVYLNSKFHHETQVSKSIFHFSDKVSRGRFKKTIRTNHAVIDFLMFWWLKS